MEHLVASGGIEVAPQGGEGVAGWRCRLGTGPDGGVADPQPSIVQVLANSGNDVLENTHD